MGQLVLARKNMERTNLYDGDRLIGTVKVLSAMRGLVRLGFEFVPDVRIVREEVDGCEGKRQPEAAGA